MAFGLIAALYLQGGPFKKVLHKRTVNFQPAISIAGSFKTCKTMKPKFKHETGGYGGCLLLILVAVIMWACSCSTQRNGCGTEHYKHSFNK